jgi:amino acid permease
VAFAVVVLGFLLMWGGKEDIYSFRRITLAPIIVIAGFLIGVYAIMYKPKNTHGAD